MKIFLIATITTFCVPTDRKALSMMKGITCQDAVECHLHIDGLQS